MKGSQRKRKWWGAIARRLAPANYSDRRRLQWLMTVLATVLMLGLGVWGYDEYDLQHGHEPNYSENLYHSFALLRLRIDDRYRNPDDPTEHQLPWQLQVARVLVPLVLVLFGLMSVLVFLGVGYQRRAARRMRGHVVVGGEHELTDPLVRALLDEGERVVVLRPEAEVRRGVVSHLETLGATMIGGDATDQTVLEQAGVRGARVLVSLERSDLVNLEVMLAARELVQGHRRGLPGLETKPLCGIAGTRHFPFYQRLLESELTPSDGEDITVRVYAATAAMARSAVLDLSWYRQWRVDSDSGFHAAVFGLGDLGLALLTALARDPGIPVMHGRRITILDPDISERDEQRDQLLERLSPLCEIRRIRFDPDRATPESLVEAFGDGPPEVAYLCFEDDDQVFESLLDLTRAMTLGALRRTHVKARLSSKPHLIERWRRITGASGSMFNIAFFGDTGHFYHPDEILREAADETARAIHSAYSKAFGGASEASRQPWERLAEPFRDANRQQADSLAVKLAVLDCEPLDGEDSPALPPPFHPDGDELERLAVAEHQRWSAERKAKGWRYGDPRDDARRLHPSLIPYTDLSELEKEKDRNAVRSLFSTAQAKAQRFVRRQCVCILPAPGEDGDQLVEFIERVHEPQRPLVLLTSLLSAAERRTAEQAVERFGATVHRIVPDHGFDLAGDGCYAVAELPAQSSGQPSLLDRVETIIHVAVDSTLALGVDGNGCFSTAVVEQIRRVLSETIAGRCWRPGS